MRNKKVIPVIKERTVEAVQQWMHDLMAVDMLWHMDDDIENDMGGVRYTNKEVKQLASLQNEAWSICDEFSVDIHSLSLKALNDAQEGK